jgi:hypothetical protein
MFTPPKPGTGLAVSLVEDANQLEENIKIIPEPEKKRMFWSFLR